MKKGILLICLLVWFSGCKEETKNYEGKLDSFAKHSIFTNNMGYCEEIISEDLKKLGEAIKKNPQKGELYLARGFVYAAIYQFSNAIEDFSKAENLPVSDAKAYQGPSQKICKYWISLANWTKGGN